MLAGLLKDSDPTAATENLRMAVRMRPDVGSLEPHLLRQRGVAQFAARRLVEAESSFAASLILHGYYTPHQPG